MDVRLSSEQLALRDSVAKVVEQLAPHAVSQLDDSERAAKLDAAVVASGWRELRCASEDGEPWGSGVEAAIVAEGLARGLADTSFIGPTLAAELRRIAGAPASTVRETVALAEDLQASAASASSAVAIDTAGASAALLLDGGELASVELERSPVLVDLTRPTVQLEKISQVTPVGCQRIGLDQLTRWKALGLVITCADLVGVMQGAIELACDYAKSRRQYGVPVGSFQAVQHMLSDAFVAMEGSRSVALHAAWSVDALDPHDALAAASLAKAYCARSARDVCEIAIQVHGGIGNTWDCMAHVFLRRALVSIEMLGGVGPSLGHVLEHHGIGVNDGLR